jgi:DNA-binding transcriptional MerR regulator
MFNPFGGKKKKKGEGGEMMEGPGFGPSGPPRPPERRIVPVDEVRAFASRGVSEPDIIRTLRREGYSTGEIDQAMKEALRSRVSGDFYGRQPQADYGEAAEPAEEPYPGRSQLPRDLGYPGSDVDEDADLPPLPPEVEPPARGPDFPDMPSGDYFEPPRRPAPVARQQQRGGVDRREIEELAEVIVDEKLRDTKDRFKSVDAQFQQFSRKLESISDELNRIRMEKSGEVKGIESKIDSYSRNMDEMNGKMESMEKALRDSLSPMLESLRSLSELVKSMKEKQSKV